MSQLNEAWFYAKKALLAQGVKSIENGFCKYRGPDDTKCFIGHLIANEHYDERLEGEGVACVKLQQAIINSGWNLSYEEFLILAQGQSVHDRYYPSSWDEKFEIVETRYGLHNG